jgi:hypothetical protein
MNKKLIIILFFFLFWAPAISADSDAFSRSFTEEKIDPLSSLGTSSISNDDNEGIHPMIRYDINKYFLKGAVISTKGSLAIISYPGGLDYILYLGDPIGNDMNTLKKININYVIAGKKDSEDYQIPLSNPVIATTETTATGSQ